MAGFKFKGVRSKLMRRTETIVAKQLAWWRFWWWSQKKCRSARFDPTTIVYWGYIGIMEKNMETTIVYCGYIGVTGLIELFEHVTLLPSSSRGLFLPSSRKPTTLANVRT